MTSNSKNCNLPPQEFSKLLPKQGRILGIDPGKVRIGIALSDLGRSIASPAGTIKRGRLKEMLPEIQKIIKGEEICAILVGLPLEMNGSEGSSAQSARDWGHMIADALNLPITFWDERFSSSVVNRFLIEEVDISRKKRSAVVDKMAASYQLQGWLDAARPPCTSFDIY
ncbi:Holliday junction resolvase RuvX [Acetobacteraceae bacterium]|nr:Holliday junction resolvase RuvX [Acetobacteraceae bacterium]